MDVYPNYYNKFECIANRCKHSCCIGWEIDIDDDTMELYSSLEGELADKIRANIKGDVPHFIPTENERCPFLNKSGLCDIITEYGDGAICDICYLHPRFRNFYENFEEVGLGLCCEEAARIILTEKEKFFIPVSDDATEEERDFFTKRQKIFDILQNRDKSIRERFLELSKKYGFKIPADKLYEIYISLERLDEKWTTELEKLKCFNDAVFEDEKLQIYFEQLACYFIFRHFKGDVKEIKFALSGCYVTGAMCRDNDFEKALDVARMYSSEIEYSEENVEKTLDFLIEN